MIEVTPQEYALIFDTHRSGQKIYEDLINRFGRLPNHSRGIDRVLDQAEYNGRRAVLEFIATRINQANGVEDNVESIQYDSHE